MIEVLRYLTEAGDGPFGEWMAELRDTKARASVAARTDRLSVGNFGDCKPLREGVWELRIDIGPGYRVYYALAGETCVLLLAGGDKGKQSADISRALSRWKDYVRRTKRP